VAILVARTSSHVYAAQLGVLKAGAAYTCIDVAFPDDQVRDILFDSGAVALLTDATAIQRISAFGFPTPSVIDMDKVRVEADTAIVPRIDRDAVVRAPDPTWLGPDTLA
jgi:non-ribosomal peptide synthetase component F